jgi:hypothetical protein
MFALTSGVGNKMVKRADAKSFHDWKRRRACPYSGRTPISCG